MIFTGSKIGIVCCSNGQKTSNSGKIEKLKQTLVSIGLQQESAQQIEKNISQLNCYADQMELTEEIKEKLIDKVNVYSDNRIEICWSFDSGFLDVETTHKCG